MAKNNHITNSFISGEASPKFAGRTDTNQYNQSCEELTNALVYPQGGAGKRPGTVHVVTCTHPVDVYGSVGPLKVRLFPFSASDGTQWQIAITDVAPDTVSSFALGTFRPWKVYNMLDHSTSAVENISLRKASYTPQFGGYWNLTTRGVPLEEINYVQVADTLFLVHPKMRPMKIKLRPALAQTRFCLTGFPRFQNQTDDGTTADADNPLLPDYMSMPFQPPVYASGLTHYYTVDTPGVAGKPTYRITLVAFDGISMNSTWVGREIRFNKGAKSMILNITEVISSTQAYGYEYAAYPGFVSPTNFGDGVDTTASYEESYWNDTIGWPRTVSYIEGRLVFGGSPAFPDKLWWSASSNIMNMMPRKLEQDTNFAVTSASDPFVSTINSNLVSEIRWMYPDKTLSVGTKQRENIVKSANNSAAISLTTVASNPETPHGGSYVQAVRIDNATVFLQRDGRTIRELNYTLEQDSFKAENLSIIGEHMAEKGTSRHGLSNADPSYFKQLVMQQVPHGIMWALDSSGSFSGLTRDKNQNIAGWHYHEIAGIPEEGVAPFTLNKARVQSLSVNARPSTLKPEVDELWMTVSRRIPRYSSGSKVFDDVVCIEKMALEWLHPTIHQGWSTFSEPRRAPTYLDQAYIANSNDATRVTGNVVTGLPHGYGQTVRVMMNGIDLGDFVVSQTNTIDLTEPITSLNLANWSVVIGYPYMTRITPQTPEVPAQLGSSMSQPRRIDHVTIHFLRTIGATLSKKTNAGQTLLEEVLFSRASDDTGTIPMFTGGKTLNFGLGVENKPRVVIESDKPFPLHVTHIVSKMVVYE